MEVTQYGPQFVELLTTTRLDGPVMYSHVAKLGDMLVQLPRIRFLARRHNHPVHVVTRFPYCRDLLQGIDYISAVDAIGQWRIPFWLSHKKMLAAMHARKAGIDWFYAGEHTAFKRNRFMLAFAKWAGVPKQHIFPGLPEWYAPAAFPQAMRPDARDAEPPALVVFPDELTAFRDKLDRLGVGRDFVIVHMGCSRAQRGKQGAKKNVAGWSLDNWAALLKKLNQERPDLTLVLTGSGKENQNIDYVLHQGVTGVSLYGQTSVRELLALAALAHSCISNDTGMAHIASASGCPLVVIFSATDPRYGSFTPQGWGPAATVRGLDIIGKKVESVHLIRPETVFHIWQDLPPRPVTRPKRPVNKHYVEGNPEPELVEPQIARILVSQCLLDSAV